MEPPPAERAPTAAPTTLEAAADQLVQTDPLLRRARPETPEHWAAVPQAGPLVAWAALAAGTTPPPKEWDRVEANFPGTLAVPLVRGAALAVLEAATAGGTLGPDAEVEVLPWLGPVVVDGAALPAAARGPLEWLGGAPEEARGRILHIAERRTLLGWLDGPDLPTAAAAGALQPGVYDRLRDSPTGALLLAHDAPRVEPAQGEAGRASSPARPRSPSRLSRPTGTSTRSGGERPGSACGTRWGTTPSPARSPTPASSSRRTRDARRRRASPWSR